MLSNRFIINSSPLIVVFKSQQANLLPQLFTKIFIAQAVWDEITDAGRNDAASQQLPSVAWARRVEVSAVAPEVAAWNLGNGESEVLILALQTSSCAVIIEDRAAR